MVLASRKPTAISTLVYPARRSIIASAILLDRLMTKFNISPDDPMIKTLGYDVRQNIDKELLMAHCETLDNFFNSCPGTDIKLIRII